MSQAEEHRNTIKQTCPGSSENKKSRRTFRVAFVLLLPEEITFPSSTITHLISAKVINKYKTMQLTFSTHGARKGLGRMMNPKESVPYRDLEVVQRELGLHKSIKPKLSTGGKIIRPPVAR